MNRDDMTFDDLPEDVRRELAKQYELYGRIVAQKKCARDHYESIMDITECMRDDDPQAHIAELDDEVGQYDKEMSLYIKLLKEAIPGFKDPAHTEVLNRYIEKLKARRESIIDKWLDIKSSLKKENGA